MTDPAPHQRIPHRAGVVPRAWAWCLALVEDSKTGRPNTKKIGEVVVGITLTAHVWNYYILGEREMSWDIMAGYAGVVLGWATANYWLKGREQRMQSPQSGSAP